MTNVPASQQRLDSSENRPLVPTTGGIAAAESVDVRLDNFLNHLLLICPLQHEDWETSMGNADVIVSHILDVRYTMDADNKVTAEYDDLGEMPVFWAGVKRQLDAQATKENPWVLGKLTQPGRAYKLEPPLPEDLRAAELVLAQFQQETSTI